ncbi:MAG: TfoX/Sxy family protein [Thermomicrobiales bacterium]|nr:TfoX/Sxy family protein [Thermomicrobiales bacterium]
MNELETLPNIGTDTARQLVAVGITTCEQLREVGAKAAWLRIQEIDPSACLSRLSALEGAIQGMRWHHLDPETRTALKAFYEDHRIDSIR